MPREILVDTSAWIALADKKDNWHSQAAKIYPQVLRDYRVQVTTNLIVAETQIALRQRLGFVGAMGFLVRIRASSRLLRVQSTNELEIQAEAILRQYDDQDLSYADAVSIALMRERRITDVFTFDHHFPAVGFHIVGEKNIR